MAAGTENHWYRSRSLEAALEDYRSLVTATESSGTFGAVIESYCIPVVTESSDRLVGAAESCRRSWLVLSSFGCTWEHSRRHPGRDPFGVLYYSCCTLVGRTHSDPEHHC
jgi:hypothetical protein